jgi:4-amino-4-deoxy-L-arabinose transferase-like glycosyltransferase
MADPYLAFFVLACLWAWVKAARLPQRARGFIVLFYLMLAMGLLAKGPPLFVHLVIAIGAFHWCFRRKWPGTLMTHLAGIALTLLIVLPWPIYILARVGASDVLALWQYQSVGELGANTENARPWWFYPPQIAILVAPWFTFAGLAVVYLFARPKTRHDIEAAQQATQASRSRPAPPARRHHWFPLLWFAATVLFFSFAHMKKNAYLLPAMPALVLLMAQGARFMVSLARGKGKDPAPYILAIVQGICGIGLAVWLAWLLLLSVYRPWLGIALPIAGVALAAAAWPVWIILRRRSRRGIDAWLPAQSIAYVILISLLLIFYNGAKDNRDSPRTFIAGLLPQLQRPGITLYRMDMAPEAQFYVPDTVPPYDSSATRIAVITEQSSKRAEVRGPAAFAHIQTNGTITETSRVAWNRVSGWAMYELTVEQPGRPPATSR